METVNVTITIDGNRMIITPNGGPFEDNSIYEIVINGLKVANRVEAPKLTIRTVTKLSPMYCSVESVQALVEDFAIPEETLMLYIRDASRNADFVRKSKTMTGTVSFEVEQYVKTKAALDSVLRTYMSKAASSATRSRVGEVETETKESLPGIKSLLDFLKQELRKWEDAMRGYYNEGRVKPQSTVKSSKTTSGATTTAFADILDINRNW